MLFRQTPKWVKNFPHELDKAALENLAKSSKGSFDKPREMNFVLYDFTSKNDVEYAISEIEKDGWKCRAYTQEDEPDKFIIECQKQDYVLNEDSYPRDSAFFHRVADLHNGKYDGWFASN